MRGALITLLLTVFLIVPTQAEEPAIRDFDIETLQNLGKELHTRDQLASQATDLMIEAHPECRQLPIRGWASDIQKTASVVYFIQERDGITSLAYTVTFPAGQKPVVKDQIGEAVPPEIRLRFVARQTAMSAVTKRYTPRINAEVVDDPAGKGFLVYVLASTNEPNQMVVGGHYRVTVSPDGRTAERVDALSRSFLTVPLRPTDLPKGAEPEGVVVSHIVSDTPVETHVFVSLLHKTPIYVGTSGGVVWRVSEGAITKVQAGKSAPEEK